MFKPFEIKIEDDIIFIQNYLKYDRIYYRPMSIFSKKYEIVGCNNNSPHCSILIKNLKKYEVKDKMNKIHKNLCEYRINNKNMQNKIYRFDDLIIPLDNISYFNKENNNLVIKLKDDDALITINNENEYDKLLTLYKNNIN